MLNTDWLLRICLTEGSRVKELGHPWTITRGDGPWTIATDGRILAATRGAFGFPDADLNTPNFEPVLVMPKSAPRALPLTELRALATPWLAAGLPTCEVCMNSGRIECDKCDGEGFNECECDCGHEHERDCGECKGLGYTDCKQCSFGAKEAREARPVWIGDSLFDLRLFAEVLANIEGDTATFWQDGVERAAHLAIGDWCVLVMPMRCVGGLGEKYSTAPRITFHEPSHV